MRNVVILSLVFNVLNAVKIQDLLIPDLVQNGNVTEIILDCQFSKPVHERLTVRWYFNRSKEPVYLWKPRSQPKVSGILSGRLDLSFRISTSFYDEGRALRIIHIGPDLSGEYSCSVESDDTNVILTKTMLVFNPEQELLLKVEQQKSTKGQSEYTAKCIAIGIFPAPDLLLEYENDLIEKQKQRVWRSSSDQPLFDAESTARFAANCLGTVTCRLVLPEAGYTSIKETIKADQCRNQSSARQIPGVYMYVSVFIFFIYYLFICK